MKKISAFRSKGGMKFLFSSLFVIVIAIVFILTEEKSLGNYIFISCFSYYLIIIFYYRYIE